jgi:hypothetical protein
MTRKIESNGRTLKVLDRNELLHVIGGTDDPSRPIGDPGDNGGGSGDDLGAVAQNWTGHR